MPTSWEGFYCALKEGSELSQQFVFGNGFLDILCILPFKLFKDLLKLFVCWFWNLVARDLVIWLNQSANT